MESTSRIRGVSLVGNYVPRECGTATFHVRLAWCRGAETSPLPLISTPYWHSAELLKDQRGILVPFANPKAIAREVIGLLRDETRSNRIGAIAYGLGRNMVWTNTGEFYTRSFDSARKDLYLTSKVT